MFHVYIGDIPNKILVIKVKNTYNQKRKNRSADVHKLIAQVRNTQKRNLLRGIISKVFLDSEDAEKVRKGNSPHDNLIAGALLKGHGLLERPGKGSKRTSKDLNALTSYPALDWKSETRFAAGYINSRLGDVLEILSFIRRLSHIENLGNEEALEICVEIAKKYGASNFLSYKLAYLRCSRDIPSSLLPLVSKIEDEMEHRSNAGTHFSALENISSKISIFVAAQRRISGLVGRVDGDFRKAISLGNFVPTPLHLEDVPGFLLRAMESSLFDTLYSVIVIFNLDEIFNEVRREFSLCLAPDVIRKIEEIKNDVDRATYSDLVTDFYVLQGQESEPSLDLYRVSAAFLERPRLAQYRNKFDRVIGARLLAEIIGKNKTKSQQPFANKELLLAKDDSALGEGLKVNMDTFYRTFLFLRFIEHKPNLLELNREEIKFILERTIELDVLLSDDEMRALYVSVPEESKNLMTVLALALFRAKSVDPDVDFEFRTGFISYVNNEHSGSVLGFIKDLLQDSPQVANYIVSSLDEVTLEKMYTLVKNASKASEIRCEILRAVGERLNRIEFFVEADAISTRSKLAKLQKYFDSSRMFVDSVAMKKWLDSNPTVATEQYRSLYKTYAHISTAAIEDENGEERSLLIIQLLEEDEYLITQIAEDAFHQFCLNTEFGIQSYLGRRIRHNTLDGVTTETVDAVLNKPDYGVVHTNSSMRNTVAAWMESYKSIIDKLRRDHLQFKSAGSLFKATLDHEDSSTIENIRSLSSNLRTSGGSQFLNDLVVAFCWKQITPQLESAARFIKTSLLQEAHASIDKYFTGNFGAIETQLRAELHEAVNEVFKKVADWFQVPQTGFISATVHELCQIILIELGRTNHVEYSGSGLDIKYTGISVHRLYDCIAALLINAHKYGEEGSVININVDAEKQNGNTVLDTVKIDVTSTVIQDKYLNSKQRINSAIQSEETGSDMVTEGYTGIKKIKFITRSCEGVHTVRIGSNDDDRKLTIGFTMHAEISNEDFSVGAAE